VMCDPQTSGGLLVAVDPASRKEFQEAANDFGVGNICGNEIGKMISKGEKVVTCL